MKRTILLALSLFAACEGGAPAPAREQVPAGASPQQTAVDHGLQWLAAHQDEDGRWDCDGFMKHDGHAAAETAGAGSAVHDVGATGLAVLAFLGAGNTMRSGPYKDQVKAGVRWLIGQQDQQSGLIGTAQSHDFIYSHAIATWALCEAYGLSKYDLVKSHAQRGLNCRVWLGSAAAGLQLNLQGTEQVITLLPSYHHWPLVT